MEDHPAGQRSRSPQSAERQQERHQRVREGVNTAVPIHRLNATDPVAASHPSRHRFVNDVASIVDVSRVPRQVRARFLQAIDLHLSAVG